MSLAPSASVPRRGFLFRLSQGAAGLGALFIDTSGAHAAVASVSASEGDNPDAWMKRLTGENKLMIHVHQYFMSAVVDARINDGAALPAVRAHHRHEHEADAIGPDHGRRMPG